MAKKDKKLKPLKPASAKKMFNKVIGLCTDQRLAFDVVFANDGGTDVLIRAAKHKVSVVIKADGSTSVGLAGRGGVSWPVRMTAKEVAHDINVGTSTPTKELKALIRGPVEPAKKSASAAEATSAA